MVGSLHGSPALGAGSPRGVLGEAGGAARPPQAEYMVSIHQSVETLKRDASRASAGAQLCCGGAGVLRGSDEISGCGQDSSAPAGAVRWLIYGGVIARIMALSQQLQCSPHHPSPGWDGAGWVSPAQLSAPGREAAARSRLLTLLWLCAGDRLPLSSCRGKGRLFTRAEGVGRGEHTLSALADGEQTGKPSWLEAAMLHCVHPLARPLRLPPVTHPARHKWG